MPQTPDQEVLLRTFACDSKALAQNQAIQAEHVAVQPEKEAGSLDMSGQGTSAPAKKSSRMTVLLLVVFLLLGGALAYLLMNPEQL